jgi:choline dehydrogenase-like flavoprotein
MSLHTDTVSPKAAALPPLPTQDPLTPEQWRTLFAITDAVIPSIQSRSAGQSKRVLSLTANDYAKAVSTLTSLAPSDEREGLAETYLNECASSNPAFRDTLHRFFGFYAPQKVRNELQLVLNILNTRAGSLILTGYVTPFADQPPHIRESIIQGWATARIGLTRQLFRSFTMLTKQTWIRTTSTLPRMLGFPRVPVGMVPSTGFDYEFVQFPPGDKPETIETDVVIVGSGCGAGVCAKNLAEAGHRVLVVEKSYHWTPDHFPMEEGVAPHHLFMDGGAISSDDNSVNIIAGQAWGGGGTINWSASLQTQGFVRKEWADGGLPFFNTLEFQASLDRVCERMGVSTEFIKHNPSNQLLMEGARRLGWAHKPVPQNTGGKQHACGHCTYGCGSCEKQGPVVSFLPDAAQAGAKFIEGFNAEKILFSEKGADKVATGVIGTWRSRDVNGGVAFGPVVTRKVIIKAKRVIVSAGTMQSPLLLLRSGIKNHHVGRNLYVHPVSLVGAFHEQEIHPWDGACLTSVVTEFDNLDGKGHGTKLEATNMLPSSFLLFLPWKSGLDYKLTVARGKHLCGYISICRDRDTGQVYPDPVDGRVRFKYTTSAFDKQHVLEGVIALAKLQYAAGAMEIFTVQHSADSFVRGDNDVENDARFARWLHDIRKRGLPSPDSMFMSAHQMGTCRMAATPKNGVVDPEGRVWGTKGLYVADASVFPSASGVNPMVTNMAISDWISRGIARKLGRTVRL